LTSLFTVIKKKKNQHYVPPFTWQKYGLLETRLSHIFVIQNGGVGGLEKFRKAGFTGERKNQ
jgi:hypothetical protein